MRLVCLLTMLLLLMLPVPGVASTLNRSATDVSSPPSAPKSSPYTVTVPVADTSADARGDAFAVALEKVLSRVTGQPVSRADAATAIDQAASYVRQYHYESASAGSKQDYQLVVSFAPSAIQHLVNSLTGADEDNADDGPGDAGSVADVASGDEIWVSGIHSALDFAAALDALRHGEGVSQVDIRRARGEGMLVRVTASVPMPRLVASLEKGGLFVAAPPSAGSAAGLRWVR